MNTIRIDSNDILKKIEIEHVEAFMFAEGGAMGMPGEIKYYVLLDGEIKLYKGNRYNKGISNDMVNALFTRFNDQREWFHVKLGMGNHLCLKTKYQEEFEAARSFEDEYIYNAYEKIVIGIFNRKLLFPSLDRFIEAQKNTYETALEEIRFGRKRTFWMWFIFPQIKGLGSSPMTRKYAISNIEEAKAYMQHPVLSARLIEISNALIALDKRNPVDIFGYTDSIKLRSSMTLFAHISEGASVFHRVLDQYYHNDMDELTLKLISMKR